MTSFRQGLMERVQSVLRDMFLNDSLVIADDTKLDDIPEWDSMLHVTLVMALEREFDVRLNAREASQSVAIRSILDLLEAKCSVSKSS
jgi:acyl carrier protein